MASTRRNSDVARCFRGLVSATAVAALAEAPQATAATASASLSVSVVVLPRAVMSMEAEPASLEITAADIARGYLDVRRATRARVRTNSPGGWLLQFDVLQGPFRSLEVSGHGAPTQESSAGGWVIRPYPPSHVENLELGYRFNLAEGAQPGVYPWPVALSAQPR